MDLGRFGVELYRFDTLESDPRHLKWVKKSSVQLIVGRGCYDDFVAVDSFGGAFTSPNEHLWMDFNIGLKYLPSDWATCIVIDYSTWRYMKPMGMINEWYRILEQGGKIYFEHGISSFKIAPLGISYQNENPSHLVLDKQAFLDRMARIGKLSEAQTFLSTYRNQTIIIPANEPPTESLERKIGYILKKATLQELFETYQRVFNDFKVSIVHIDIQTSHPVAEWIQLQKL